MEGNQLTFFITSNNAKEAVITLSQYDTIGDLKKEIFYKFKIDPSEQEIIGWDYTPSGDDNILNTCCTNDVVALEVYQKTQTMDWQSSSSNHDDLLIAREMDAISTLKEKLPISSPLVLNVTSFQEAIACSKTNGHPVLLFLYNSEDKFTQQFLTYINDDRVSALINEDYITIGWDVENIYHHPALIRALENYPNLYMVVDWIKEKVSAAICVLPDNDGVVLFFRLKGDTCFNVFLEYLKNTQQHCSASVSQPESSSTQKDFSDEIRAIKSLKRKLPSSVPAILRHSTLDEAITFICNAPLNERKVLLLYFHNSTYPFSDCFTQSLMDESMAALLNTSFLLIGWDLENPTYHDALKSALNQHADLASYTYLIERQVSVGLCIIPVNNSIQICMCLQGKCKFSDIMKSLREVEKGFNEEIQRETELKQLEEESSNNLGSEQLQAIWADMLGSRDYDSFAFDQKEHLKAKIGFALFGPPKEETGYNEKMKKRVDELFAVIKEQAEEIAELKDHIEISFVFACLEPLPEEKMARLKKFSDYNPVTDLTPVPIFILRKCRNSDHPCRIIIDSTGRVYENWTLYLTKNKYQKCVMVVPAQGRYEVINNVVQLEKHLTPACQIDTKILQVGDVVSTAAGLASGAVFITASLVAIPFAGPALLTAGVIGAGAGLWGLGRSIHTLVDRKKHRETMSFMNSEARGAYLNIVAGSLGFIGAGANAALTQLISNGVNIGKGGTYVINTISVLNLGAGGVSLANSGYEVLDQLFNDQTPSALAILQLSTSVLFFGHAVYNFKPAQTIIDETQARVLQDYSDSLRSNRHRKTFGRLIKETLKVNGDSSQSKAEVIATIKNLQNKDEVFAALTRNTKALNEKGVRFSVQDGQITFGGMKVSLTEFAGLNKKQAEVFLSNLAQEKTNQVAGGVAITGPSSIGLKTAISNLLTDIHVNVNEVNIPQLINVTSQLLNFCNEDTKTKVITAVHLVVQFVLSKISKSIGDKVDELIPKSAQFTEFLRVVISYFSSKVDDYERKYQEFQKTGNPRYYDEIYEHINLTYAKRTVQFFEFAVRYSYSGHSLTAAALNAMSEYVTAWITRTILDYLEKRSEEEKRQLHSAEYRPKMVKCTVCSGTYFSRD